MPYKFETEKKLIAKKHDKRRKLTELEKRQIKELYPKMSQRALAKMFGVCRRTIIFIGCPEKHKHNLDMRKARGGSAIYYDKDKQKTYMQKHRTYKKQLDKSGLLEENQNLFFLPNTKTNNIIVKQRCLICKKLYISKNKNRKYCQKCRPRKQVSRSDKKC